MEFLYSPDVYSMPAVAFMVATVALSLLLQLRRRYRDNLALYKRDKKVALVLLVQMHRYDVLLVGLLCLAILVYSTGNLSLQPAYPYGDGIQNLELGIRLAQEGRYSIWDVTGFHEREPFVPFLIAAIDLTRRVLGHEPVLLVCVDPDVAAAPACPPTYLTYAPYKVLNVVFLLLAGVSAFFIVLWFTRVKLLAYAALLLTTQSRELLSSADSFYTEVPAAGLMVATSVFALLTITRRRPIYSVLLGLVLAALVLTKTIFAYLWIFIIITFVLLDLSKKKLGRSTLTLVGFFLVAYFIPLGAWMTRNYATSGDFSLVAERPAAEEWGIRAAYNEMRDDEFFAGFLLFFPVTRSNINNFFPKESYERLTSFYFEDLGRRGKFYSRERELNDGRDKHMEKVPPGMTFRQWSIDTLASEMRAEMLADPWQHFRVSLLLGWRGVFRCCFFGLGYDFMRSDLLLADTWGFTDWPSWSWSPFGPVWNSLVRITTFLALIVVPLWFWFSQRRFETVLIVLPALYAHGLYAVASSFIPRYGFPLIPLRIVAAMLLVFLLVSALYRLGMKSVEFVTEYRKRCGKSRWQ